MVPKNMPMHFHGPTIKTVGEDCEKRVKSIKNGNDLGDLDFDLGTSRSLGYVDLVYNYLPCKYGDDRRSLRLSNAYFKV